MINYKQKEEEERERERENNKQSVINHIMSSLSKKDIPTTLFVLTTIISMMLLLANNFHFLSDQNNNTMEHVNDERKLLMFGPLPPSHHHQQQQPQQQHPGAAPTHPLSLGVPHQIPAQHAQLLSMAAPPPPAESYTTYQQAAIIPVDTPPRDELVIRQELVVQADAKMRGQQLEQVQSRLPQTSPPASEPLLSDDQAPQLEISSYYDADDTPLPSPRAVVAEHTHGSSPQPVIRTGPAGKRLRRFQARQAVRDAKQPQQQQLSEVDIKKMLGATDPTVLDLSKLG